MSLFQIQRPEAALRLIVLPYAGGGTADFRRWQVPDDVEVLPARLPAREGRLSERPYRLLSALVDDLVTELPTDRPYVLYGHSLGAWVAYELAHALRAAGRPLPLRIGVGARQAPHRPSNLVPLGRLPRAEFIAGMIERYDAIPEVLRSRPELLDTFLPALRADVTMYEDYVHTPRPLLDVPLHAFTADDDPSVDREDTLAWGEHTTGDFRFHPVTGGHFFHRTASATLLQVLL